MKIDALRNWSLTYRLLMTVIASVSPGLTKLGLETKELLVLSEIDAHPHPAELAEVLLMPKPSVTVYLKRLEALGHIRREIDPDDLRRHRILVTPAGRKVLTRGLGLLSDAFAARLERLDAKDQAAFGVLLEKIG